MGDSKKKLASLAQARASLSVANPKPASSAAQGQTAANETLIRLHINQVRCYERDPRKSINPNYVEIKESIRARGIENIVKVTKRPGEDLYIPVAGGNTRIKIVKELFGEPDGERFGYQDFLYTPYTSEADILARHFIENDHRADLTFWDKAAALIDLKRNLEQEEGHELSLRDFSAALSAKGVQVGKTLIGDCQFAVDKLARLGPALAAVSRNIAIDQIKPIYAQLRRLVEKFGFAEDRYDAEIVRPLLEQYGQAYATSNRLEVDDLCAGLFGAVAVAISTDVDAVRKMASILARNPEASRAELTSPDNAGESVSAQPEQATPESPSSLETVAGQMTADESAKDDGDERSSENVVPHAPPAGIQRPGKATDILFATGLTPGDHTRRQPANPSGSLDLGEPGERDRPPGAQSDESQLVDQHANTPSVPEAQRQGRNSFLARLREFAEIAELSAALRFDERLPFGFYMELPVPREESVPLDMESKAGGNPYRYMGWWYLTNLCGFFDEATRARMPADAAIVEAYRDDEQWDDQVRTTIGEPLYEDSLGRLMAWMVDADNPAGAVLLSLMAELRALHAHMGQRQEGAVP